MAAPAILTPPPPPDLRDVIVRAEQVKKIYRMGDEEVQALKGIDLDIYAGEYLSIMGPSGSGKSTFFNMVGGLDKPSEGKVYINGVDVAGLNGAQQAWLRCHEIGYIFSDVQYSLSDERARKRLPADDLRGLKPERSRRKRERTA